MNGGSDQKAMIAAKLRPYYEALARERQEAALKQGNKTKHGGKTSIPEKIPESKGKDARDEAGKAAGVNGKYVDMAALAKDRQEAGNNQHTKRLQEKIPEAKKSQARDEAGRAAGIISEPSKKKIIHSKTPRVCQPPVFARN